MTGCPLRGYKASKRPLRRHLLLLHRAKAPPKERIGLVGVGSSSTGAVREIAIVAADFDGIVGSPLFPLSRIQLFFFCFSFLSIFLIAVVREAVKGRCGIADNTSFPSRSVVLLVLPFLSVPPPCHLLSLLFAREMFLACRRTRNRSASDANTTGPVDSRRHRPRNQRGRQSSPHPCPISLVPVHPHLAPSPSPPPPLPSLISLKGEGAQPNIMSTNSLGGALGLAVSSLGLTPRPPYGPLPPSKWEEGEASILTIRWGIVGISATRQTI